MVFVPILLSGCWREYLDKDNVGGHVARMAGVRKTYRILAGNVRSGLPFEKSGADGRIKLNSITEIRR
jgi:hypothetical protein